MAITWLPVPTDHRARFNEGYFKYAPFFGKPVPDWYWDPSPGQWVNLPTGLFDVSDRNWPSINVGAMEIPDYDTLYGQWAGLPSNEAQSAYWDPGRKKWLQIVARTKPAPGPGPGPDQDWIRRRGAAIQAAMATVFNLEYQQFISADTDTLINDALESELKRFRTGSS